MFNDKFNKTQEAKIEKIKNQEVLKYISGMIKLCEPRELFVNTGSNEDISYVKNMALTLGEEIPLAKNGHTMHFDNYNDQARDKENTRILVPKGMELQNTNTLDRDTGVAEVLGFFKDIMRNKTMIIGFYSLGPSNSEFSIPCLQITDSFYVTHSENILYRSGYEDFVRNEKMPYFFRLLHSAGKVDDRKTSIELDKRRIYLDITGDSVYSVNTQYAGNSVGLKKLSMRLAIYHAQKEGWLCEHMLLMGIKGKDKTTYIAGAFPSMCGKTSTAMIEGETIVGDDIAYIREVHKELRAVNVEKGMFGIIQGINSKDDPLLWKAINKEDEVIFSNILMTKEKDVHWIGKDGEIPQEGINFSGPWKKGNTDKNGKEIPVSHLNARFTMGLGGLENLDPDWDNKGGMLVSALVYGGRDSDTSCPVEEAFDWSHGIIIKGASLESETTAATLGKAGVRVIDPMSNMDFVSVPLGNYIKMNLDFGKKLKTQPAIFGVNYFLKDKEGKFINGREDKKAWYIWIEKRVNGRAKVIKMPTGNIPLYEDLKDIFSSVLGKDFTLEDYNKLFTIRIQENLAKLERIRAYYTKLKDIPKELFDVLNGQKTRLLAAKEKFASDYILPSSFK
ncbi:MAG: phosphoenolpyruvate carboxykinase (GTP) [Elusimicrobia bacterium]|nr:phosphoenolpyruvate carboxykinase (GTP) [Candidatus Liberimonas magnetica]